MKRAVIYARYSSDAQRATSIEDQERLCRRCADSEGWSVARIYSDEAISGTTTQRPGYQAMLAAAGQGEFDVLLVDDLSRLARDSMEQERAIRKLEFQGLRIIATSDGYDSDSKARKIHRAIKGLQNEMFIDDLSAKVHRGQEGQALKRFWCGGRPYGYSLRPVFDSSRMDAYGQPEKIGTMLAVHPEQSQIVREIFTRYVDESESCLAISKELNARGVPSPGSTWRRKTRRCTGWMASAVRVILKNPLYTGQQRWNSSQFVKDPETGRHLRRARPQSEWVTHQVDELRIVDKALFDRAQSRTRVKSNSDERLKAGGRAKYQLSGLLTCDRCGAHYVMADGRSYACSGHWNGRACSNDTRVRRDEIEHRILKDLVCDQVLAPDVMAILAKELERDYLVALRAMQDRRSEQPRELQEIDARLERLRERAQRGDPDLAPEELQIAIDRVIEKRAQLLAAAPEAKASAKLGSALPAAAAILRRQIERGLDGDPREAMKARATLRRMFEGGKIPLQPSADGKELWAVLKAQPAVLVKAAGTGGRGDRI